MSASMLEKLAKILNQAENAGTPEEAAVFMAKAQALSTTHSIDLARVRHITKDKQKTVPVVRAIQIGLRGDKGLSTLVDLFYGIAQANDIKISIAHSKTTVYAHGFAEDIDVAEALFASLQVQQAKFLAEFKAAGEWKNDKVYQEPRRVYVDYDGKPCRRDDAWDEDWVGGGYKPVSWITARINFQDGFAGRISTRLRLAKYAEQERIERAEAYRRARPHLDEDGTPTAEFVSWVEANHGIDLDDLDDETGTVGELTQLLRELEDEWAAQIVLGYQAALEEQAQEVGTALVLAEKAKAVEDFYYERNPHFLRKRVRSYNDGSRNRQSSYSAQSAGRAAGDRASIGNQAAFGSSKGAIGA